MFCGVIIVFKSNYGSFKSWDLHFMVEKDIFYFSFLFYSVYDFMVFVYELLYVLSLEKNFEIKYHSFARISFDSGLREGPLSWSVIIISSFIS